MRIVSFLNDGQASYGLLRDDGIVDARKRLAYTDLKHLLRDGTLEQLQGLAGEKIDFTLAAVELTAPIPNPDKILCIGINYRPHLEETGRQAPDHPTVFLRLPGSQVGHGQPLIRPHESAEFDFEGELAVVIGKGGRRIAREQALHHVAGYACYNDGSIRDWQRHSSQFSPGKNFMNSGAFGPWMVSADEVNDPRLLSLQTRLNGKVMQQASIEELIFDIPSLIEYCSTFIELTPGDVLVTGTPGGVGAFRTPAVWLQPGDKVEVEISRIGVLSNLVAAES